MRVVNVTADADTFTCNAYLAPAGRPTLVDAGAMEGVVDRIREETDELDAVVLTHQHGDHVSELDAVVDAFDPDVYACGDHPHRTEELDDCDVVTIGEETFDVVYTPGHADDHVSLISETTIFSGDVVVHDDGAFDYGSFGRTDYPGQSREQLIDSIERILDRLPEGVSEMYAGHGDEFRGDDRESNGSRARQSASDGVRDVIETALSRAEKREPKYPDE